MTEKKSEIVASCPWCDNGETLADTTADIRISCQCPFCGNYYRIDFNTMRVVKIRPRPRKTYRRK